MKTKRPQETLRTPNNQSAVETCKNKEPKNLLKCY